MRAPDTILQNRYRIVRPLGAGGMGTLYEAIDERVSAVVALKEMNAATSEEARREFEREAGLLANLRHRALPKVMDYFVENAGVFVVMEYVEGSDLLELFKKRGAPFPVEQVLKWADDILDVLDYLHKRQPPILHRDIKPANLKLTLDNELFLLDFGLAKGAAGQMATLLTERSARGYTPVYAPLEQIIGKGTDQRSDLYSLGATLYHLLTGVPPTDAATRYELVENGLADPLLPIANLNPRVPQAIAEVIQQAMSLQRKDRFDSATVMRQALERALAEEARPSTGPGRLEAEGRPPEPAEAMPHLVRATVPTPVATLPQQFPSPPDHARPRRRTALFVLLGALVLAVAAILIVLALTRRTDPENKIATDVSSTAAPQPAVVSPGRTPDQSIKENIKGVELEMVPIPGGSFVMGSPMGEGANDERPQHRVQVAPFYMSKYEVTQAQYIAVMRVNPSEHLGDMLPVEGVSWNDAREFCNRLSRLTGRVYRLPTEAEWEYACRAGTTTKFAFGNSITSAQANFDGRSPNGGAPTGQYVNETTAVGNYRPNGFGLYDMHGNVWEWCVDIYHNSYNGAPTDGSGWVEGSGDRVVRGGSWLSIGGGVRSAVRDRLSPDSSFAFIGFRLAAGVVSSP